MDAECKGSRLAVVGATSVKHGVGGHIHVLQGFYGSTSWQGISRFCIWLQPAIVLGSIMLGLVLVVNLNFALPFQ